MKFRPPYEDFGIFKCEWPENGRKATSALAGSSVALLGWIPFYHLVEELPEGFMRTAWSSDPSIPGLLGTGNLQPPRVFEKGETGLLRHLETRDFRGAICIAKPTLYLGELGKPVLLRFRALGRPGFTAIRPGHFVPGLKSIQLFDGGFGRRRGDVYLDGDRLTIRVFMRMKLGLAGQAYSRLRVGNWPPWATMMLEYTFDLRYQTAQVDFHGTAVPSQRRYMDWRLHSDYEIEKELSAIGYEEFVEAGACQDALATRTPSVCPLKVFPLSSEFTTEDLLSIPFDRDLSL
jgi:hypothetical protein